MFAPPAATCGAATSWSTEAPGSERRSSRRSPPRVGRRSRWHGGRAPPSLATGSELRPPGEPLQPGQIYEANSILLEAQLASAGADAERLTSVADEEEAHREALARGLEADVLVTSGGVSVGPHDLVRAILG